MMPRSMTMLTTFEKNRSECKPSSQRKKEKEAISYVQLVTKINDVVSISLIITPIE